ncbi:MAG: endonuclease/exonuclease/phosphatase family protein [Anaerolineae bacterium]
MRVLSYNIHGWRSAASDAAFNLDILEQVIGDANADLVGLNEVFHPQPTDEGPALAALAARLGMYFAFGPAMTAAQSPTGIPYGNALLSRWPILAYAAHRLGGGTDGEPRGLLEGRVLLPTGRPFTLYVTHLDHRSEAIRLEQWRAALTWLTRERGRPHLVIGDFNALSGRDYPAEAAVQALRATRAARGWPAPAFDLVAQIEKAGYCDAFAHAGIGDGATFPAAAPEIRIDYIFLPAERAADLLSCRRWEHPLAASASDHLPLLAELA